MAKLHAMKQGSAASVAYVPASFIGPQTSPGSDRGNVIDQVGLLAEPKKTAIASMPLFQGGTLYTSMAVDAARTAIKEVADKCDSNAKEIRRLSSVIDLLQQEIAVLKRRAGLTAPRTPLGLDQSEMDRHLEVLEEIRKSI